MGKLGQLLNLDLSKNVLEHASTYIFSVLKGYAITVDEDRNIYVTKGVATYPTFIASIDSDYYSDTVLIERIIKNVWVGYEQTNDVRPANFAAGPKVAIYLALKLLEKLDDVKCVFKFTGRHVNKMFFDDCRWVLELNGKGNTEILTTLMAIPQCSESFTTMLKTIGKKYGYEISGSGMPSVSNLGLPISVVNIPNGHYAPFSGFHQVVEGDVAKALHFCTDMGTMITTVCKLDGGCTTCGCRLTRSETYFCYPCLNKERLKSVKCQKCYGVLYTAEEIFKQACRLCGLAK